MKIVVVAEGKLKEAAYRALRDDYLGRLAHYCPVEEKEVGSADKLERAIPDGAWVVALEVLGKSPTSLDLARYVAHWSTRGKGVIAFIIGGAEGIPKALSARADFQLSLSQLTLPHRLARIVLLEQLYRAMSINNNEPYAREG
ncbi:MAG: 23S rRNA (pseudouridine(1915)-N(3))-methyltransferase RlmH [Polyangiaceae bacterium]|nr:23S rRNA (pseudouridine(1915)-N(3))-methyltransferase RlmH [Polyangiaceae bacterium]